MAKFSPGGAEENFFWGAGCFPAGPRTTSIFLYIAAGGKGAGKAWDGVISRPAAGALEGAPAVVRE